MTELTQTAEQRHEYYVSDSVRIYLENKEFLAAASAYLEEWKKAQSVAPSPEKDEARSDF